MRPGWSLAASGIDPGLNDRVELFLGARGGLSTPVFYSWLQKAYLGSVNAVREAGK
jgi:hypothetical protein